MTRVMTVSIPPPGRGRMSNLLYHPDYITNDDSAEILSGGGIAKFIYANVKIMVRNALL